MAGRADDHEVEVSIARDKDGIDRWTPIDGRCNGKLSGDRGLCRQWAGAGTTHKKIGRCDRHGGATATHLRHAQKQWAAAAVLKFGLPRKIDPHTALLEEVHRTAGRVAFWEDWARGQNPADLVWGMTVQQEGDGKLVGSFKQYEAAPSVILKLEAEERKHLVRVCAEAIRCGIEERAVKVAEQEGQVFFRMLTLVLAHYGVDIMDDEVRQFVGGQIRLLTAGGEEGNG